MEKIGLGVILLSWWLKIIKSIAALTAECGKTSSSSDKVITVAVFHHHNW